MLDRLTPRLERSVSDLAAKTAARVGRTRHDRSDGLPPGPGAPGPLQLFSFLYQPVAFLRASRATHGEVMTIRLPGLQPIVQISKPKHVEELFKGPARQLHAGEANSVLEPFLGSHSVLVIDDDPKAREIVLRCLTQEGLNVRSAEDGQDGLRVLESEFPDVIVLDLLMPVMDGFEFVTEFKIRYPKIPIPIIVMTAHEPTEQERRQLSGAVSTIMKKQDGMNTDGLLSEIKNILVSGKVS